MKRASAGARTMKAIVEGEMAHVSKFVGVSLMVGALAACSATPDAKSPEGQGSEEAGGKKGKGKGKGGSGEGDRGAWTAYEDTATGLRVELPCASPEKRPFQGTVGIIRFEGVRVTCESGGAEYTLEYWSNADLSSFDRAAIDKTVQALVPGWLEDPQKEGYGLQSKQVLDGPVGWIAVEARFMKGAELRADRHYMLLPRHVFLSARSPQKSAASADRFLDSLRVSEPGTSPGKAPTGLAQRTLTLNADRFSVILPCAPVDEGQNRDETELGPLNEKSYACRHPSANSGFNVMIGRFERPLPTTATEAERQGKNALVAGFLSRSACAEFQKEGIPCKIGSVKAVGARMERPRSDRPGRARSAVLPFRGASRASPSEFPGKIACAPR